MSKSGIKAVTAKDLNLSVIIEEEVYEKIMYWCNKAAPNEVSGLGSVIYDKELKALRVTEAWLLEQENTSTTTDIDENSIGKLEYKHHLLKKKGSIEGELKFWWHSHVNMGVFWSGTDMDTIAQLGGGGWFLSTVFNLKEEMRSAVYQTDPMEFFADNLDTYINTSITKEEMEEVLSINGIRPKNIDIILENVGLMHTDKAEKAWDKEYEENVKVKTYTPSYYGGLNSHRGTYSGYYGNYYGNSFSHNPWVSNSANTPGTTDNKKSSKNNSKNRIHGGNLCGSYNPEDIIEDIYYTLLTDPSMTDSELASALEFDYPGVDLIKFIRLNRDKSSGGK